MEGWVWGQLPFDGMSLLTCPYHWYKIGIGKEERQLTRF